MQIYFKALKDNKIITKKIQAESIDAVLAHLKSKGYYPIIVKKDIGLGESIFSSFFDRIGFSDIVNLTRQIAIMLNAGLTLIDCFDILKKQTNKQSLLSLLYHLEK